MQGVSICDSGSDGLVICRLEIWIWRAYSSRLGVRWRKVDGCVRFRQVVESGVARTRMVLGRGAVEQLSRSSLQRWQWWTVSERLIGLEGVWDVVFNSVAWVWQVYWADWSWGWEMSNWCARLCGWCSDQRRNVKLRWRSDYGGLGYDDLGYGILTTICGFGSKVWITRGSWHGLPTIESSDLRW